MLQPLLANRTERWLDPVQLSPYDDLLEVPIAHTPDVARRILRSALEVLGPPIPTDADVEATERLLGVRLPRAFVELVQRGETTLETKLQIHDPSPELARWLDGQGHVFVDRIRGISPDPEASGSVSESLRLVEEWDLPRELVLLCGDGHTWVALDYRDTGEPRVVFAVANCADTAVIAEDFDELLGQLEVRPR
ncbi:MAG: SMI1/KNR4 family protein [Sandaracinus sp.]|nr:SMI1/KNR4 family protein [Sandaracinus sp.]MCB9635218.1 SMI1/KNR4 family protein [Sandaracinus sp.]